MRRLAHVSAVATAASAAGCFLVSSFDRYDADAPDLVAGDSGTIQAAPDADGPFTVRVDAPRSIDAAKPATVVVRVVRTGTTSLRATLDLPQGVRILPSNVVDVDGMTNAASFAVDVAEAPRGLVKGAVRVERIDGSAAQTVDLSFETTGPGDLDATFGDGGAIVFGAVAGSTEATTAIRGAATSAGGTLVIAGSETVSVGQTNWKIARVSPTGIDISFGSGGFVTEPLAGYSAAHVPLVRPDGLWVSGVVAAGNGRTDLVVRRYTADGVFAGASTISTIESDPPSSLIAPASDGVWLAGWDNTHFDVPLVYKESVVAKLDAQGNVVLGPIRNQIPMKDQMRLGEPARGFDDSPGALRLVGDRLLHTLVTSALLDSRRPVPARIGAYRASGPAAGLLDASFGAAGIAETTGVLANETQAVASLAARPDGSFVVVGGRTTESSEFTYQRDRMLVASFSAAGTHDTGFRDPLAPCEGTLFDAVVDAAGRTVVVGYFGPADPSATVKATLALVRLKPDGDLDRTFGSPRSAGGTCADRPGFDGRGFAGLASAVAERVILDADGRLLVLGRGHRASATQALGEDVMFVARFRN